MGAERFFSEHPWETGRSGPRAGPSATPDAAMKEPQFAGNIPSCHMKKIR